jgi:phosphate transport system substrate-binding protein
VKSKWIASLLAIMLIAGVVAGCSKQAAKTDNTGKTQLSGTVTLAGSTSVQPLAGDLSTEFMAKNPQVRVDVAGGGSAAGIKAAQEGTADIGMASRALTSDEAATIQGTVIANDGIAIIVNAKNKIAVLTKGQIKGIFAGTTTNWKQVGGSDASINAFTREEGSGTRDAFTSLIMGKDTRISVKAGVQNSTGAIRTAVAGDENGISYMSLGSLDNSVKTLKVDGVTPSKSTVTDGTYKIQRPFVLLTKGVPKGLAKSLIDFILSVDGQKIVGKDYVELKK